MNSLDPEMQVPNPLNLPPALQLKVTQLVNLLQSPAFAANAEKIRSYPNLKWMFLAMATYLVLYLYLKYRVIAMTPWIWLKVLVRVPLALIFLGGEFGIAYLALGKPFVEIGHALWLILA